MAFLRTVIATCLSMHISPLYSRKLLFDFFVPVTLSPLTRIAPGEIVMVETVIISDRHPIPDKRALINFFNQGEAYLKKFRRSGNIDVLCSANSYRL